MYFYTIMKIQIFRNAYFFVFEKQMYTQSLKTIDTTEKVITYVNSTTWGGNIASGKYFFADKFLNSGKIKEVFVMKVVKVIVVGTTITLIWD